MLVKKCPLRFMCVFLMLILLFTQASLSKELTLDEAIELAVTRTSRAEIIKGNLEVAEKNYFAERVNFYLPEISIKGNVPAYSISERWQMYGTLGSNELISTKALDFKTYLELNQSLITGGQLTVRGNIVNNDTEYPDGRDLSVIVEENTRQGVFDFEYEQPLLKPSEAKNELKNKSDDLEIARLTKIEEVTALKKEIMEAYFGVLQLSLQTELVRDKEESARLQADIDSAKFQDGVTSEETWLESASAHLDTELEQFDIDNQRLEKNRELAILLDFDTVEVIEPTVPEINNHLSDKEKKLLIERWAECVEILKAQYEYRMEQRAADYTASSHGLTGNLTATYSLGRGTAEKGSRAENLDTDSWGVSLNFDYPIWDGGASGAQVKAARLSEEKARIEYERTKRSARAEIVNLINRLDISYRKLELLNKQIELAKNKLDIAKFRLDDGQISRITYLENKIDYLEAKNKHLEELKNYLLDKTELERKYSG